MNTDDALRLFGTTAPRPEIETFSVGRVSFELASGALQAIRVDGLEVIRSVSFPVRDRDWGTLAPDLGAVQVRQDGETCVLTWSARFQNGGAELLADLTVEASPGRLQFTCTARAKGDFETNRAGFTVLHPVSAAGCPARVEHSDGETTVGAFPGLIEPWQPFMDIRSIAHDQNGLRVTCRLEGDTFEMEDQRQWSDASFKTYNRPLALPWPYVVQDGERLAQSVELIFGGAARKGAGRTSSVAVAIGAPTGTQVPELALVLTPNEARAVVAEPGPLRDIGPQRLTLHLDPASGDDDLAAFARLADLLPAALDLEYAARCDGNLNAEFDALARSVQSSGLQLASVFVCPSVDRQSTPPGAEWPDCPPLEDIHAAAARAFPDIARGGGMLSYFPEFNRKRPPVDMLDYVSHGTNPIVHAADDRSVMQTLTAIPWILRSGRAIAGAKPYRLGLSSIPMRQNPYGSKTMDNPDDDRICMANHDPRHFATFGAAFALGYLAEIAPFGIDVWTPAAAAGPRGISRGGDLTPLGRFLVTAARLAGAPVRSVEIDDPERLAALAAGNCLLVANLTDEVIEARIGSERLVSLDPYQIQEFTI